jgi:formate dehydrogenase major subunit
MVAIPFGNAKARAVVWNFPDPIPQHREPIYSTRPELVDKYPTHDDRCTGWRLPVLYKSLQEKNRDIGKEFPLIMTSGRLVEYEGGGDETRSNPYLAELQQEMFVEINPAAANDRGIRNGEDVWVKTPTGAAAQGQGAGDRAGRSRNRVPAVPLRRPVAGRGHLVLLPGRRQATDHRRGRQHGHYLRLRPVTMMQETKTSVCQIEKAA